ncbi:hypothetical protein Hanom_Chr06g00490291 [Helianthus anomalus]
MPSSYPGRHMSLPRLEPSTSEKRWVSVANWATPVGSFLGCVEHNLGIDKAISVLEIAATLENVIGNILCA